MNIHNKYRPWLILAAFLLLLGFCTILKNNGVVQYKDTIELRNDSITALNSLNWHLSKELEALESSLVITDVEIIGYQTEIVDLKEKNKRDRIKHEKEIANIIRIPIDSLYQLVTDRLK